MVWPLLPLVIEGQLHTALLGSAVVGICARYYGWSMLWGLTVLLVAGLAIRVWRIFTGPRTKSAGTCSREDHAVRRAEAEAAAKLPGPLRMFKKTASNTFRPQQIATRESKQARLDLSEFTHVLEINADKLWCDIEASATFETFVTETLARGVGPLVVPELRTITVGGAIVGIGLESSSFRHGFFHDGLIEADVLLASGEVVTVSPDNEYAELFRAIPNSLGSFGYLLRLRMRVQKVTPLLRLDKVWFDSPESFIDGLEKACHVAENDYVDGVAFSETGGMLITARFVKSLPKGETEKEYGVWPQFYPTLVHEGTEYISTLNYLWRWDADWFWVTQIFPGLGWRVIRWLCGPDMLRSDVYKAFNDKVIKYVLDPTGLNKNEELIIQDIDIPVERSVEWINTFLKVVPSVKIGKIKLTRPGCATTVPMWVCPIRGTAFPLMPQEAGKIYMNFGFWDALEGPETKGGMSAGTINRALEQLCTDLGGLKTLYSSCYWSEEDFFKYYNGEVYKKVKAKFDPNGRLRGWHERLTKP